jgi:hypothetical protein
MTAESISGKIFPRFCDEMILSGFNPGCKRIIANDYFFTGCWITGQC